MMNSLYSAATGMMAMQSNMDVIANNLANVNTTGFKATRLSFEDLLYQQLGDRQSARLGAQAGMGVAPGRTDLQMTQGDVRQTDINSNVAIQGQGFFQVAMPNGQIGYSRDGDFSIEANGQIVNGAGYRLEPNVTVPVEADRDTLKIGADGEVTVMMNGSLELLHPVEIATFTNPGGLVSLGSNTFAASVNSGNPIVGRPGENGLGTLRQGFIEGSNVSVMNEMVEMINAQRAFESVSKVLSTSDEMLGIANAMRR